MVSIHWGGYFAGRGTKDFFGPEKFMDKDVIVVTFNYRLGVMGENDFQLYVFHYYSHISKYLKCVTFIMSWAVAHWR